MEGPLEIKSSSANVEEPIKSEALVQNSDSNSRSDGATSPPNCSICLGKLVNTCFTDSCLHQFCFTCLLQWSKIKTECPLCKQTFKSIINNVRSEEDYDQYHVPRKLASQVPEHVTAALNVNFDVDNDFPTWEARRFAYRTTMTGNRRPGGGPFLNPEQVARREQLPSMAPQVPREERRRRRANPTDYRRTIYRHGIWATSLPDVFGRFRECSAEYYRRHPQELDRLVPWLNRELQVLLNNEPSHCAYVLTVIMDALTQFDIRSAEFRNIVRPFFTIHTNHFAHELLNFAQTNFDLVGYDQSVTYLPRGLSNEYARIVSPIPSSTSSSSSSVTSDNSDVRILEEAIDLRVNTEIPSTISNSISMPGPSTAGSTLPRVETSYYDPELLILSSSSESDGECEIIGYVKPRHERTPEIIELLSSESEHATVPHTSNEDTQLRKIYPENLSLPSTSHGTKESSSSCSSTSRDTNSDSDHNQKQSKQNRSRKSSEKKFIQSIVQKYKRSRGTKSRNKRSKKRISTFSDTTLSEDFTDASVKNNEKRSKKTRYKVQTKGTGRIKLIKREQSYSDEDSSSSDSSSEETDSKMKINKCRSYRSKRKHSSPTVNDRIVKSGYTTRGKERASILEKLKSKNKDQKYCESKQSRSRSSSESSDTSEHDQRSSYRFPESRDTSEYESQDDSASIKKDMSKKEHKAKSKKKVCYDYDLSYSDLDFDHLSSSSQCSNHSNKSYTYRKKSKRREKHKEKEHHRSNGRGFNSQSNASTTLTISVSSKNDMHPSKHSDKEKRKSYKVYKDSKRRKSENEKRSRVKKKRRRLRSSSISNSA